MPYTEKQLKLFYAASKDKDIAKKHGLTKKEAAVLATHGLMESEKKRKHKEPKGGKKHE